MKNVGSRLSSGQVSWDISLALRELPPGSHLALHEPCTTANDALGMDSHLSTIALSSRAALGNWVRKIFYQSEDNIMSSYGAAPAATKPESADFKVAGIYARWTLDCVVDAATAIAHDYRTRYRQYRDAPAEIATILADMMSKMGYDPQWPNTAQRSAIEMPLLGSSDAQVNADTTSPFYQTALNVRMAAIAYSERVYDTGEAMLREAFVDAARQFQAYLSTLSGGVIDRAIKDTGPIFQESVKVLTSKGIAQAFGIPPAPGAGWPLPDGMADKYLNGDGAYLMEEVSRVLQPPDGLITQQHFLTLQRAAVSGARTIQRIFQGAHENAVEKEVRCVIEVAYTWATALRDLEAPVSQAM